MRAGLRGVQGELLLLSPTPNVPPAFPAPARSRLRSTPLRLALLRNGPGRGGQEDTQIFFVVFLLGRDPGGPKLERHRRAGRGSGLGLPG